MRKFASLGAAALLTVTMVGVLRADPANAATAILSTARVSVASSFAAPSPMAGPAEYDPTNISSIGGYAHTDVISIAMGGGTANRPFSLDLRAPTGAAFSTGMYYGDDAYGVRGYAYLGEGNSSCSNVRFTIVDIASSGNAVTRLDVRFQSTCNYTDNANALIFGELQLGEPSAAPDVVTGARSISWPNVALGTLSRALLPLWYRNTASTSRAVGSVTRSGSNATDFAVASDGCSNRTLAAHASCSVVLAFAPGGAGVRSATLSVPIGGRSISTAVAGTGSPGRTLLRINSQAGDWVGGGRSYLMTDAQSQMQVENLSPDSFIATTYNGPYDSWTIRIQNRGAPLRVGTYSATRISSEGMSFNVDGQGHGCASSTGTVNIRQVAFDSDSNPTVFDATFSQTCSDSTGAGLTGEVAYRATDAPTSPTGPFIVHSGHSLAAGSSISNGDGSTSYKLAVTTAGRAVLADASGKLLWATPATAVAANDRLAVRTAGDLSLLTSASSVLWTTATTGSGNFLVLQSDGNLVLYNAGYRPIWAAVSAR
jgi:hypothetical protein